MLLNLETFSHLQLGEKAPWNKIYAGLGCAATGIFAVVQVPDFWSSM